MKTCVVCISKNSHDTINDWVEHYLNIGFTHIFLFDNNDYDKRYKIDDERVTVIPYDSNFPIQKYNNCNEWRQCLIIRFGFLMAFDQDFDYCFVCDDDEYLDFKGNYTNVNDFLNKYNEYDSISIPWEIINDNGYIYISDEPEHEKLNEIYGQTGWKFCEYKSFYKLNGKNWEDIQEDIIRFHPNGNFIMHNVTERNRLIIDGDMETIEVSVKHYPTYCMERYLIKKSTYSGDNVWMNNAFLRYYFRFNIITEEKMKAYISLCNKYNIQISYDDKCFLNFHGIIIDDDMNEICKKDKFKSCVISVSKMAVDINDWCNHYLSLGFDHIFLFDNNDYANRYRINDERITIIRYPSEYKCQMSNKTGDWRQNYLIKMGIVMAFDQEFDYCFICDDDEYLDFKGNYGCVNDFLNRYKKYDSISVRWEIMDDNDYIYIKDEPDGLPLREVFNRSIRIEDNYKTFYKIPKDWKTLQTDIENANSYIMHRCTERNLILIDGDDATTKHYITFSMERYLKHKGSYGGNGSNIWLDKQLLRYFSYTNKLNREKIIAYIDLCDKYNIPISDDDRELIKENGINVYEII